MSNLVRQLAHLSIGIKYLNNNKINLTKSVFIHPLSKPLNKQTEMKFRAPLYSGCELLNNSVHNVLKNIREREDE